jgi:beta-catenin-like protein 1
VDVSAPASEETSHILGIIASLLTNLNSESPERIRLLTKFVEGDYEKVDRLLDIREGVEIRLRVVEKEIDDEKKVHNIDLLPTFSTNVDFCRR